MRGPHGTLRFPLRRRVSFRILLTINVLAQPLVIAQALQTGESLRLAVALAAAAISLVMLLLSTRRPLPETAVSLLGLFTMALWVGLDVVASVQARRPPNPPLLTNANIMAALALTFLPYTLALPVVAALAALLLTLFFISPGEPVLFTAHMVLLGLQVFSINYGRQLMLEQAHSAWLRELAFRDAVTGVANRHVADDELAALGTQDPDRTALALIDLDHFKQVNDSFGHETGDRVLRHVAALIRAELRPEHTLARWGGEEFLVIVRDLGPTQVTALGERILAAVRGCPLPGLPPQTVSLGGAWLSECGGDVATTLALADRRLYAAKESGRDQARWTDTPPPNRLLASA